MARNGSKSVKKGKMGEPENQIRRVPLKLLFYYQFGQRVSSLLAIERACFSRTHSEVEDVLRRLATYFGGDKAATDSSRILRIPGTLNYKYDPPRQIKTPRNSV
jgi:hypothetical protein